MTQQSNTATQIPPAAVPPPAAPAADEADTLDARRAALLAPDVTTDETPTDGKPAAKGEQKTEAKPDPAAPPAETDPAKRAEDRRARLAEITATERRKVDAKTRLAENDQLRQMAQAALKRAEAAEKRAAKLIDPSKLDEAAFFALAEQVNIDADKLGTFIQSTIANPSRTAAALAAKQVDPKIADLEAKLAESTARLQKFLDTQEEAKQTAQESEHETEFVSFVKGAAATSPFSARFAEKYGDGEFLKIARAAATGLPPGAGAQVLLDTIEEQLEQLSAMYAPAQAAQPSNEATKKFPAKPTTVSNTNAQERASVVDDEEWSSLSLEERAARLRR